LSARLNHARLLSLLSAAHSFKAGKMSLVPSSYLQLTLKHAVVFLSLVLMPLIVFSFFFFSKKYTNFFGGFCTLNTSHIPLCPFLDFPPTQDEQHAPPDLPAVCPLTSAGPVTSHESLSPSTFVCFVLVLFFKAWSEFLRQDSFRITLTL